MRSSVLFTGSNFKVIFRMHSHINVDYPYYSSTFELVTVSPRSGLYVQASGLPVVAREADGPHVLVGTLDRLETAVLNQGMRDHRLFQKECCLPIRYNFKL